MDFIKGNEQIKIDPSGIDISGAGHITIDSEKIIGDICLNGDLSMNGNLEVYGGKIGIGKTPAYNYNLDIVGAINCTGGVYVDGSNVAGSGSGKPIVAKGMAVQIQHKDYNKKVKKESINDWVAIDSREDGNGFVVKIKPNSVNSKVLVSTVLHVGIDGINDARWWGAQLWRKVGNDDWQEVTEANGESNLNRLNDSNTSNTGSSVWFSDNLGAFYGSGNNYGSYTDTYLTNCSGSFLDSPGTTQEVAYTIYWKSQIGNNTNQPIYLNGAKQLNHSARAVTQSSLTATEIWDEPGAYIPTDAAIMVDGTNDNVGIGTSTPATGVDIHRDLSLNGNIEISGNDTFVITNQGWVGIGTNDPKGALHIIGGDGGNFRPPSAWASYYYSGTGVSSSWPGVQGEYEPYVNVGLAVENPVMATIYHVFSDRRIKTDISLVDDDTALNRVNALESKEYNYIDPERKRPMKTIGFIAQEVKEVIPNAVSLHTNFVPDEMRIITEPTWSQDANNNWLLDIPDLDMSGAFTGKAKFYVSNDTSGNDEVCKEVEIKSVETDDSTPLFPKTKFVAEFDQSWNNVFFYGKEVSDFHTIDKAQIFALHHSAIQELSRRNDEKTQRIDTLENKVNNMTVVNAVLKSSNENLKNRLEALETIVAGLQNN